MRLTTISSLLGVLASAVLALTVAVANAQSVQRIAAVVNDEIISTYDVEQRIRLVLAASNREPTQDLVQRLQSQVLRSLIDERLQLQEAASRGIEVADGDIDRAMEQVARQNDTTLDALFDRFAEFGVDPATFREQLRAELAWNRLVSSRFAPRASVSSEEVRAVYDRVSEQAGGTQYRVSEIFLGVDNPQRTEEVRENAQQIIQQLRQGARFSTLAAQFSEATTATNGGDMGWITRGQLPPALDQALADLQPGMIAGPIHTQDGFYIIGVSDRREAPALSRSSQLSLKQIVIPVAPNADADTVAQAQSRASEMRDRLTSCDDVADLQDGTSPLSGDLGTVTPDQLPPGFRAPVRQLKPQETTAPLRTENGFHVLILCDRTDDAPDPQLVSRIEQQLREQQVTMLARRYLRDLRRDATIVVR